MSAIKTQAYYALLSRFPNRHQPDRVVLGINSKIVYNSKNAEKEIVKPA